MLKYLFLCIFLIGCENNNLKINSASNYSDLIIYKIDSLPQYSEQYLDSSIQNWLDLNYYGKYKYTRKLKKDGSISYYQKGIIDYPHVDEFYLKRLGYKILYNEQIDIKEGKYRIVFYNLKLKYLNGSDTIYQEIIDSKDIESIRPLLLGFSASIDSSFKEDRNLNYFSEEF